MTRKEERLWRYHIKLLQEQAKEEDIYGEPEKSPLDILEEQQKELCGNPADYNAISYSQIDRVTETL